MRGGMKLVEPRAAEKLFEKAPANFMWGDGYNHPNEVTHLVPFMFPYCGRPWPTQNRNRHRTFSSCPRPKK